MSTKKELKVVVKEIRSFGRAAFRDLWITKCVVEVIEGNEGDYTLTMFSNEGSESPKISENQVLHLKKYTLKEDSISIYKIEGTKGEIVINENDIITDIENPVFSENEKLYKYDKKEYAEFRSLKAEIEVLKEEIKNFERLIRNLNEQYKEISQNVAEKMNELKTIEKKLAHIEDINIVNIENAVKYLVQFLPAEYDEIWKIYIDVRDLRRGVKHPILIKKEGA